MNALNPESVAAMLLTRNALRQYQALTNEPDWFELLARLTLWRRQGAPASPGEAEELARVYLNSLIRGVNTIGQKWKMEHPLRFALLYALYTYVETFVQWNMRRLGDEIKPRPETPGRGQVFEFLFRTRKKLRFHLCYAEACDTCPAEFRPRSSFQLGYFIGCHGSTGYCRVRLEVAGGLSRSQYTRRRVSRLPWMDVEEAQITAGRLLLAKAVPRVPERGFRRTF